MSEINPRIQRWYYIQNKTGIIWQHEPNPEKQLLSWCKSEDVEAVEQQRDQAIAERDSAIKELGETAKRLGFELGKVEAEWDGLTKCHSCGEPLSRDCPTCKRLWES